MSMVPERRQQAGFTLMELLIGIVVGTIFMLAIYGFFDASFQSYTGHQDQALAQAQARDAMNELTSQLRQAVSPDNGITPPVVNLSPTQIEFYADMNRSLSEVVPKPQEFLYQISNGQLLRQISSPVGAAPPYTYGAFSSAETLVSSIANTTSTPLFSAVNASGAALAASITAPATAGIGLITVNVLVGYAIGHATEQYSLSTDVAPQNPTTGGN
jgi:prepilin-type N-terminal cleavage/methylation domain-containing protein